MLTEIHNSEHKNTGKSNSNSTLKGQSWSLDFLFSLLFVFLIILMFLFLWQNIIRTSNDIIDSYELNQKALSATDSLMRKGSPAHWHTLNTTSNVNSIGLLNSKGHLDKDKIDKMEDLNSSNYSFFKKNMGLNKYDFLLTINSTNTTVGRNVTGETAKLTRMTYFNGSYTRVVFQVIDSEE